MEKKIEFKPTRYPDVPVSIGSDFSNLVCTSNKFFDQNAYQAVIEGRIMLYIAKNIFPQDDMARVANAFYQSPNITNYDVFPTINRIGTPLYCTNGGEDFFLNTTEESRKVNEVYKYANTPNYLDSIIDRIESHFDKRNIVVRPLQYKGMPAFYGVLREWSSQTTKSELATEIHEDRLQQRLLQKFELIKALHHPLVSNCIYFANEGSKGELIIYDLRPSLAYANLEQFNSESKYGFSDKLVTKAKKIIIRPEIGDFIAFNSSFMHAVRISDGARITGTFYTAPILLEDQFHIIYWS